MADLIVVLDGARLVELGTHEELMARAAIRGAVRHSGRRVPVNGQTGREACPTLHCEGGAGRAGVVSDGDLYGDGRAADQLLGEPNVDLQGSVDQAGSRTYVWIGAGSLPTRANTGAFGATRCEPMIWPSGIDSVHGPPPVA